MISGINGTHEEMEDWFAVIFALITEVDLDGSSEKHLCHCLHRAKTWERLWDQRLEERQWTFRRL